MLEKILGITLFIVSFTMIVLLVLTAIFQTPVLLILLCVVTGIWLIDVITTMFIMLIY